MEGSVVHTATSAKASFRRTFSAAHRIWNDRSPCKNVHGHNYKVLVQVEVPRSQLTAEGFSIPFGEIKGTIDQLDHCLILHHDDPLAEQFENLGVKIAWSRDMPSTENVAQQLADDIRKLLPGQGIVYVCVNEIGRASCRERVLDHV